MLLLAALLFAGQEPLRPYAAAADVPAELRDADLLAAVLGRNDADEPRDNLIARATIPIAAGDFDPAKHSLVVHDVAARKFFAAQADVVAVRGDGTPEVIEAVFPASVPARSARTFAVFRWPAPAAATPVQPPWPLDGLLVARCRDALGRPYSAKLLAKRRKLRKDGPYERLEEFFAELLPETPAAEALPRTFRCHAFVTTWKDEPAARVQLHFENAPAADPPGEFAYDALEVGGPGLSFAWETLALPESHPTRAEGDTAWTAVVPKDERGSLRVAFDQWSTTAEFVVARPAAAARATEYSRQAEPFYCLPAFGPDGGELRSWHSVPAFGPMRVGIPRGPGADAARRRAAADFAAFRAAPPEFPRFGPLLVHGEPSGISPGGGEIHFTCPLALRLLHAGGHADTWRALRTFVKATLHRQRFGFWNEDGAAWTLGDYLRKNEAGAILAPRLHLFDGRPYPQDEFFQFGRAEAKAAPAALALAKAAAGRMPKWAADLRAWNNIDDAHLTRWAQYLHALAWLANDPLARHLAEAQGAISLAGNNFHPIGVDGTGFANLTLGEGLAYVAANPGKGWAWNERGRGWNAAAVVAGIALGRDRRHADLQQEWLAKTAGLIADSQMPNGGVMAMDHERKATFDVDGDGAVSAAERDVAVLTERTFMTGILRFAGGRSVLAQLDPAKHPAARAKLEAALLRVDRRFATDAWSPATSTPYYDVVVATKAAPEKLFDKALPGMGLEGGPTVAFYFDDILAAGHELSGDRRFLDRLAEMHGGKLGAVDPGGGNSAHAAWLLQRLAGKR